MKGDVKHSFFSSDGTSLKFTDTKMYREYEARCRALDDEFYLRIRIQNGVWATNQNKFVPTVNDLNDYDSRIMEDRVNGNHPPVPEPEEEAQANRGGTQAASRMGSNRRKPRQAP